MNSYSPALLASLLFSAVCVASDDWLPPLSSWQGASEALIKTKEHSWVTPAELTALTDSPDYAATMAYVNKLVDSSDLLQLEQFGVSAQGRPLMLVKASKALHKVAHNPDRPLLLVQAGIHSGEIDGKDAGLMLLRDIAHGGKAGLLNNADLLFIPIFSADGHERRSRYNRMNQRGPRQQGWRATAQNLNLNRDYAKVDAPEMQGLLRLLNQYQPDLYIDVHVTDGEDYQYDITYGFNEPFAAISPNGASWLAKVYRPAVNAALEQAGHIPGPLVFGVDSKAFSNGISGWTASPRYSNGYGDVRHLPTVLVENHSLKPYRQRVLGTYVLLEHSLRLLNEQGKALIMARQADMNARPKRMVLSYKANEKPDYIDFKGMSYQLQQSAISGDSFVAWTGKPTLYPQLPVYWDNVVDKDITIPKAYWLGPEQQSVISRLKLHGVVLTTLDKPQKLNLQQLSVSAYQFADKPFESRFMMQSASFSRSSVNRILPAGWVSVSTDQPLGRLAVALLEPTAPDSFFSWGFFPAMFERTEYFEPYAIEPLIARMLDEQPELKQQFEQALAADEALRNNPRERYNWFYRKMPFYDQHYLKYPVLLEL
ncbi:M14 family metallopeptidase [Rheinheimera maricola]|uniref:M14 family metallopeptidase n=1 Tax=Rheinheimera maricola TaxID=2793282 RepID=A0ABS7X4Z5_9GAMM|nr:M14 family metallopeptidase [Rheinheimera maricola]MBZ9610621.1 M14 family metallopeptidase [Rheinheimera maricola]